MPALDTLQSLLRWAHRLRLSSVVAALFAVALVLPWCAFAWFAANSRASQLTSTEHDLRSWAAAYGQHAVAVMGAGSSPSSFDEEMTVFEKTLNRPDLQFFLGPTGGGIPPNPRDGVISAGIERPDAGVAVRVSMSEDEALKGWWTGTMLGTAGLLLRTLIAAAIGVFLVRQLRWRERAQAELAAARERADALSRAKSEFLANMSHELRTPLNAILGFSEVIKTAMGGPISRRYRGYGADIFDSGTHLLNLINEILDHSKLEAGRLQLHEEIIDLSAVVAASLRLVEEQAKRSKVALRCEGLETLPCIRADELRMRQVFINLLSNAVKFTPEGGCVSVAAHLKDSGIAVEIRDTGIGMTPGDIQTALEPFGQIDSAVSRKHEGTGLGLPLAKRLMELHDGTLIIRSELNAGTAITISLPRERIVAPAHEPAAIRA